MGHLQLRGRLGDCDLGLSVLPPRAALAVVRTEGRMDVGGGSRVVALPVHSALPPAHMLPFCMGRFLCPESSSCSLVLCAPSTPHFRPDRPS